MSDTSPEMRSVVIERDLTHPIVDARDRLGHELVADRGRGHLDLGLLPRIVGHDQEHAVERQPVTHLERDHEMAVVQGIEGAPEDADSHRGKCTVRCRDTRRRPEYHAASPT